MVKSEQTNIHPVKGVGNEPHEPAIAFLDISDDTWYEYKLRFESYSEIIG
jgi:hypothetical protein